MSKRKESINLSANTAAKPKPSTPATPVIPTLHFTPPQDLDKMLYMVKVVGSFLNLYIHRKTLSSKDNPTLEPYGLANLMMFHPEQIWLAVSQYVSDEYGVYLEAYKIDDLPVEAIFKAIFVFAKGIIALDIVNMWVHYCKGFDENMALNIMDDITKLNSLQKLVLDDPTKGLAYFLGEVLKQTAQRGLS